MIFQADNVYGVYQVTELQENDNIIIYNNTEDFINDHKNGYNDMTEVRVISVENEADIMRIVSETDPALIDEYWTVYSSENSFQEKYTW